MVSSAQMEQLYRAYGRGESLPVAIQQAQRKAIGSLRTLFQKEFGVPLAPVQFWAPFLVQQTGFPPAARRR
jgi:hypothetical protein